MLDTVKRYGPHGLAVYMSVIFLDSLRFKFTDAPETQTIFGLLDGWAASLGAPGLFAHTGLFSQYVIGSAELAASAMLLLGIVPLLRRFQVLGAAIALAVITGAISFHLFTPLGIDPNKDGGGLFMAAVGIWFSAVALLIIRRRELGSLLNGLARAFVPGA